MDGAVHVERVEDLLHPLTVSFAEDLVASAPIFKLPATVSFFPIESHPFNLR